MQRNSVLLQAGKTFRKLVLLAAVNAAALPSWSAEPKSIGQITVIVQDASSAVVSNAEVEVDGPGTLLKEQADHKGTYCLFQTPLGTYQINVHAPGFTTSIAHFNLTAARPEQHARVVLSVMEHVERVEVQAASKEDFSKGLGAQVLGAREIALLPDDPDQLRARLQLLAAASGGATGDVAIQVDGFLTQASIPSKSAIREIRINPDLYSAQYSNQPIFGGGLIEIDTKPALDSVHGGAGWTWSGSGLDARDALAAARTPLSNNIWSGEIGMPIIKNRLSSFTSVEKKDLNQYAVVDAETLSPALTPQHTIQNVATPQRFLSAMERLDLQLNPLNLVTLRVTHQTNDTEHSGAGALTLADASSLEQSQRTEIQLSLTSTLGQSLLNEARFGETFNKTWLTPYSSDPSISVAGGFLSGGSGSQYSTDLRKTLEVNDTLSWALHKHTVRTGVQILRFGIDQHQGAGFNGQLIFAGGFFGADSAYLSGLDQYRAWLLQTPGVTPTADQYTQGVAQLGMTQWQTALFVQDEWQATPRLALSSGLRYEAQTNPTDDGSFAPRFGAAYSLGKSSEWVIRLRAGIFYRRIDPAVALENLRFSQGHQTEVLDYGSFQMLANRLPLSDIRPARLFQPQLTLERRIKGGTTVQAGYTQLLGDRLLHSVSALSPINSTLEENQLFYQSNGGSHGSVALVNVNSSAIRNLTFFSGYLYMNLKTNADSPDLFAQSSGNQSGEWAMPTWQSRHRFYAGGFVRLPGKLEFTFLGAYIAGNSFDITTGRDNNLDGIFNDRPSVVTAGFPGAVLTPYGYLDPFAVNGNLPRNAGRLPPSLTVDSGISRRFGFGKGESRSLTLSVRATNLTNHFNVSSVDGVVGSPLFLQPTSADPSRRVELSGRFSF